MRYYDREGRYAGRGEGCAAGLITAYRQPVATDTFDFQRLRNVYRLEPDRLQQPSSLPDEIKLDAPPVPLSTRMAAAMADAADLLKP